MAQFNVGDRVNIVGGKYSGMTGTIAEDLGDDVYLVRAGQKFAEIDREDLDLADNRSFNRRQAIRLQRLAVKYKLPYRTFKRAIMEMRVEADYD